jgi:hypothetical protein
MMRGSAFRGGINPAPRLTQVTVRDEGHRAQLADGLAKLQENAARDDAERAARAVHGFEPPVAQRQVERRAMIHLFEQAIADFDAKVAG